MVVACVSFEVRTEGLDIMKMSFGFEDIATSMLHTKYLGVRIKSASSLLNTFLISSRKFRLVKLLLKAHNTNYSGFQLV